MKKLLRIALGTSLSVLDRSDRARRKSVRGRIGDHLDDLRELAHDTYQAAANRVIRAPKAVGMNDDSRAVWKVVRFAAGVGIGVGVGLLVAPANGEETRIKLAKKAQEFGGNVRRHFAYSDLRATGTNG